MGERLETVLWKGRTRELGTLGGQALPPDSPSSGGAGKGSLLRGGVRPVEVEGVGDSCGSAQGCCLSPQGLASRGPWARQDAADARWFPGACTAAD